MIDRGKLNYLPVIKLFYMSLDPVLAPSIDVSAFCRTQVTEIALKLLGYHESCGIFLKLLVNIVRHRTDMSIII